MKHALLSASSSHRWLECTPSARLEEKFPVEESNYAAEGTLAHTISEIALRKQLNRISLQQAQKELEPCLANPMYSKEMEGYVDDYVTFVMEQYNAALLTTSDALINLESRVDFSKWVPEGFGTGDTVIIADYVLHIIDLKYGKGVAVEVEDNPQLKLYALGAVDAVKMFYDIKRIRMTIFQPRIDNISTIEISVEELYEWADNYVKPRAELAIKGEGEYHAGEHCKFCRARSTCKTRAEINLALAKFDFRPSNLMNDEEIIEVLKQIDQLEDWAKDIRAYAADLAINHDKHWEGFKVVLGRSNRKYTDEKAIVKTLTEAGYIEEQIYDKELKGITEMEKFLGKKKFGDLLNAYIVKPEGAPALVPVSDKRPERNSVASAQADFGVGVEA